MKNKYESWASSNVICPFYRGDNSKEKNICCEGIYDDSDTIVHFEKAAAKSDHMSKLCMGYAYKNCKVYQAVLMSRYADKEELANEE